MAQAQHYLDFLERLEQLTEEEAVREAYHAYVSSGVLRAPYDSARKSMHARLQQLLLNEPVALEEGLDSQADFHRAMRALDGTQPWAGLLVDVGNISGLAPVLASSLPLGERVFGFTGSVLAALLPGQDEGPCPWCVRRAVKALSECLTLIGEPRRLTASVACWPADARTAPILMLALHQGLQHARRVCEERDVILFAADWFGHGDDGDARAPVRAIGPDPNLQGGGARRLGLGQDD